MTIVNAREALALLRRERIMTLTPAPRNIVRSLVGEIVGGPVRGSWWSHAKGPIIFRIGEALEASGDVLVTKLVAGRTTFVHRAVWPALFRVVSDEAWRMAAARGLSSPGRKLLEDVERLGVLPLDRMTQGSSAEQRKRASSARQELEKRRLVVSTSEHTERGSHRTLLRSWSHWASEEVRREAAVLTVDEARERMAQVGVEL